MATQTELVAYGSISMLIPQPHNPMNFTTAPRSFSWQFLCHGQFLVKALVYSLFPEIEQIPSGEVSKLPTRTCRYIMMSSKHLARVAILGLAKDHYINHATLTVPVCIYLHSHVSPSAIG